ERLQGSSNPAGPISAGVPGAVESERLRRPPMSARDRVLQVLAELLRDLPGAQLEVLEREVGQALGRPVSRKSLEEVLVRHPDRFEADAGGRWRLKVRADVVEPEDVGPPQGRTALRRGCYVVFDLETLGKEAEGEDTEIIEIALAR